MSGSEPAAFAVCDWCGERINYGNVQVTIARNVEQTPQSSGGSIQVVESNVLLTLCARDGNRLDRVFLQKVLRA